MSWIQTHLSPQILPVVVLGVLALVALALWSRSRRGASGGAPSTPSDAARDTRRSSRVRAAVDLNEVDLEEEGSRVRRVEVRRSGRAAHGLAAERIFPVLKELRPGGDLGAVLQTAVRVLGTEFGFDRVVLRVFNPRTRLFEARAFHGLSDHDMGRVSSLDVTEEEWLSMARRAERIGNSYRVPLTDENWPDRVGLSAPSEDLRWSPETMRQGGFDATSARDLLLVPMHGEDVEVQGYFVLASHSGSEIEANVVATLEILAFQTQMALDTAQLRAQLRRQELEASIAHQQLREWEATRDNFVANVSHELRTPLTSIKAYAETLERSQSDMDDATRGEFIVVIQREADRLTEVFDDLLDVRHLEGRQRRSVRDQVDLSTLVRELHDELSDRFVEKSVRLHLDLPEHDLFVQGDVNALRQLVGNLLSNAIKFTPEGGSVTARLREETGVARLVVEDSGIGIPEHELGKIFERFYQVDASSTRAYGGQGLGLSISQDIVRWHHGRIWAENIPHGGARFTVMLPLRGLVVRQEASAPGIDDAERLQWESFLGLSATLVAEVMGTRIASIMLVDETEGVLRIEAAVGLESDVVQNTAVARGESVAGLVWKTGESVLVPELDDDDRFRGLGDDVTYRPRGLLSVPLWWQDRIVGVVNVNSKASGKSFDVDDRLLLEALAERIVLALESFEKYRASYRRLASVESGVRAMLDVGRERRTHLREMMIRCGVRTGHELGLDEEHLRALSYALRTYDLGLAQISAQILRKASPLSREERSRVEDHVQLGAELVSELEPSPRVKKMILHHHENVDGSGYPDGLQGEAIPVGARVVRLVDVFTALLHDRPFRPALRLDDAILLVEEGVGKRFCPRVAPVFLRAVRQEEKRIAELLPPALVSDDSSEALKLQDVRVRDN